MKGAPLMAAGLAGLAAMGRASDPGPTQWPGAVNPPFRGAALNAPFPDNYYGADHGGSSLVLTFPFLSPFGRTDHSRGVVVYRCAPFTPRGSEGVYGMDVWLEGANPDGSWSPVGPNGGAPDGMGPYQPVNTPNPGPSPAYQFQWTFDGTRLPPATALRAFVYVYLYNQGGGDQGNFYVSSILNGPSTGLADDPPVLTWDPSFGAVNPPAVMSGDAYAVSATAQDDNGDLAAITIWKDGVPWAQLGGNGTAAGDGFSASLAGQSSDTGGPVTFTAQATDAAGLQSPVIALTVGVTSKAAQDPISAPDAFLALGQTFVPGYTGGDGTGNWQFCVVGQTNWDGAASANSGTENPDGSWSPAWTATQAGVYAFYIAHGGDATYLPAGFGGPYTLTVDTPSVVPPPPVTPAPSPPPPAPVVVVVSNLPAPPPPPGTPPAPAVVPPPAAVSPPPATIVFTVPATPPAPAAAPSVPASASIVRVRFNALGAEATVHTTAGASAAPLWTDPTALVTSPWPSFLPLLNAIPEGVPVDLPPVPSAQPTTH